MTYTFFHTEIMSAFRQCHRRRKLFNMGGGGGQSHQGRLKYTWGGDGVRQKDL